MILQLFDFLSVEVICETVSHVWILSVTRRVGSDYTNNPEDQCEDQRADWEHHAACHPHQGGAYLVVGLTLLLLILHLHLLLRRLDLDHTHPLVKARRSFEHLIGGVHDYLQEGNRHRKQHPDVDHLDVGGDRKALGETHITTQSKN